MSLLAVIPARGGSKGIPRKNIKELCGKPLIAWTIEEAKKSKFIDRLVVSTDDEEIKGVSEQYGATVPFLRPAYLAQDTSTTLDVLRHAITFIDGFEWVLCLQPTSPLRTVEDIDGIYEFAVTNNYECVLPIVRTEKNPHWFIKKDEKNKINLLIESEFSSNRQQLPELYTLCGTVFLFKSDWLRENNRLLSDKSYGFEIPRERSVEIDNIDDWNYTEYLMEKF